MKKKNTTEPEIKKEDKSFNLGEPVRMRTGHEKPRFTTKEREELEAEIKQHFPDSPELLNDMIRNYGAKTGQEVRDIIIYGMLREIMLTLDFTFNASKTSSLDNMSLAKIRELQFRASFKYGINPKKDQ